MANLQQFSEQGVYNWNDTFDAADTTSIKNLFPNREDLARVDYVLFTNPDTAPHTLVVDVFTENTFGLLGEVIIPAGAGIAGTPCFDILSRLLPSNTFGLPMKAPMQLRGHMKVTLPGGVTLSFTALGGLL